MRAHPLRLAGFSGLAAILVSLAAFAGPIVLGPNLHIVVPGEVYRAAQPDATTLATLVDTLGIRTVINLRGENKGKAWYEEEVAATSRLGIKLVDFRMKASRALTQDQVGQLIAAMRAADKPILIHCQSGVDRTGLAAALYLAAIKGAGEKAAEDQLSLRFGHIPLALLSGYAMDRSFETMEPSLGYPES